MIKDELTSRAAAQAVVAWIVLFGVRRLQP